MSDHPVDLDKEREKRREALSLLTTEKAPICYPCAWVVCEKTRTVRCSKCERVSEPFDVLFQLAKDFEAYARSRDHMRAEIKTLRSNAEELGKHVKSLKAMDRRLLKDAKIFSEAMANWLDKVSGTGKTQEIRDVAKEIARMLRLGRWQGPFLDLVSAKSAGGTT